MNRCKGDADEYDYVLIVTICYYLSDWQIDRLIDCHCYCYCSVFSFGSKIPGFSFLSCLSLALISLYLSLWLSIYLSLYSSLSGAKECHAGWPCGCFADHKLTAYRVPHLPVSHPADLPPAPNRNTAHTV